MTLQQLDDVLKTWQGRLSAMAENLLELQAEANYRALAGEGGFSKATVRGETAARVGPALRSVHTLFECFGALQSTVDQARTLRTELPSFFGAEAKAREIHRLLFTASVPLPGGNTPLPERELLTSGGTMQYCTPDQMMESMARQFADVRDAVDVASRAWEGFGAAADRLEERVLRLRSQRVMPSALLLPALEAVQAQVANLRTEAQTDPLGALPRLQNEPEPALARVEQRVESGRALADRLRTAQLRLRELCAAAEEAGELLGCCRTRVAGTDLQAIEEQTTASLTAWLKRLEIRIEQGEHEATVVGLRNWEAAADRCLGTCRELAVKCEQRLAQRDELRGRLRALKAKARGRSDAPGAHGGSGARLGEADRLGKEAERLVRAEPIALELAQAALTHFEDALRTGYGAP